MCLRRRGSNLGPDLLFQSENSELHYERLQINVTLKFIGNSSSYHLPIFFQSVDNHNSLSSVSYVEKSFNYANVSTFDLEQAYGTLPTHPVLQDFYTIWDNLLSRCAVKKPGPTQNHYFSKISSCKSPDEYEKLIENYCEEHNSMTDSGKLFGLIKYLTAAKENAEMATKLNYTPLNLKSQKTAFGDYVERVTKFPQLSKTKIRQYYRSKKWFWKNWSKFSSTAIRFSLAELNEAMLNQNKQSVGFDFLPYAWLPKNDEIKSKFLAAINLHLFEESHLHARFTTSKLTFIKKQDGSARPIGSLSRLGCLVETLMCNRLMQVIQKSGKFSHCHGFLKNRSCDTLFADFFDKLSKSRHDGNKTAYVSCDFSKAYDYVDGRILLIKLKKLVQSVG